MIAHTPGLRLGPAAALVTALLLTACSTGETSASPTESATPSPSSSSRTFAEDDAPTPIRVEPTPTVTSSVVMPLSDYVFTEYGFTSIGPLEAGQTFEEWSDTLGFDVRPSERCYYGGQFRTHQGTILNLEFKEEPYADDGVGRAFSMGELTPTNDLPAGPVPLNSEGIGLGSGADQVLAAYPGSSIHQIDEYFGWPIGVIVVNQSSGPGAYAFWITGVDPSTAKVAYIHWGIIDGDEFSIGNCVGY